MNQDEQLALGEFLAAQMKDRGFTVKKLSDATGIAPAHIENILHANLDDLPSAPYLRGYLMRIGRTLGFNGEEWWRRVKGEDAIANSGPSDSLPMNRFTRKRAAKWIWPAAAAAILVVIYLGFELQHVIGRPGLAVAYPPVSPFAATSTSITFQGTVRGADALYLSSCGVSSSEEIPVTPDGTWQKIVLLQTGPNCFTLSAKKFLGSETNVTEQVVYEPNGTSSAPATTAANATSAAITATPSSSSH